MIMIFNIKTASKEFLLTEQESSYAFLSNEGF